MSETLGEHRTILDVIEKRLIPNEEAKRARGEVFTPLPIVRELLFGVRKEPLEKGIIEPWGVDPNGELFEDPAERVGGIPLEVWKNPDSKWLDPANGIGNFPFIAFQMLDFQLKGILKDQIVRRKHIVEKMLFMIEIDKGNVNASLKIFEQLVPGVTPNICCANTLELSNDQLTKEFGSDKFDVVMGNPPFNMPRITRGQTSTLWDRFIIYSLSKLAPKGNLAFITPQLWRKPDHRIYPELTKTRHLAFLRIIGEQETKRVFKGIGSRVDLYVVENLPTYKPALVIDEDRVINSLDIVNNPFIPNRRISEIQAIVTDKSNGIKIIHDSSMYGHTDPKKVRTVQDSTYKYPVIKSITQDGIVFLYTPVMKGHFNVPKVILTDSRIQYPINDYEGKYGMSDAVFGIPITSKEEGDLFVRAINTDRFKEIIKATKWGTFRTEYHMFEYFKPDFYKEFLPKGGKTRRNRRRGTMKRV